MTITSCSPMAVMIFRVPPQFERHDVSSFKIVRDYFSQFSALFLVERLVTTLAFVFWNGSRLQAAGIKAGIPGRSFILA